MHINDFDPITPETLLLRTEEELIFITGTGRGNGILWGEWARDELDRRLMVNLQKISLALLESTGTMTKGVVLVAESSARLENLTKNLVATTKTVQDGIATLADSSGTLETLTKKLNRLTWALVWLTVPVIAVTIGIEVLHAVREIDAPVPPIVIQRLPPTAPQTPPVSAR